MTNRKTITFQITDERMEKIEKVKAKQTIITEEFEYKPTITAIINYLIDLGFDRFLDFAAEPKDTKSKIKSVKKAKQPSKPILQEDEVLLIDKEGTVQTIKMEKDEEPEPRRWSTKL